MDNHDLILTLRTELEIPLSGDEGMDTLRAVLSNYINGLIDKNFQQLVHLLYRLDVSENKVRETLNNSTGDAGLIIADLVIERQLQKIKTRKEWKQNGGDINENEKW
jgi:hypothetical protein